MSFQGELRQWYAKHKRDLPWRLTRDPYLVWISEIILQQTRVNQGLDYYNRFVEAFPTLQALASADEQQVLRLWQGLGYYSRARNLHHTAIELVNKHNGAFPRTAGDLEKLRGIGHYTAAAIASICFDEKTAVLDGNVARVLSRVLAYAQPVNSSQGTRQLREFSNQLLDTNHPAEYNQAMMELGALVCTPVNPDCQNCPVQAHCLAFKQGNPGAYPVKLAKKPPKNLFINYLVISFTENGDEYLILRKRAGNSIWKNLYDFPAVESAEHMDEQESIIRLLEFGTTFGIEVVFAKTSPEYSHQLTHRTIKARFTEAKSDSKPQLTLEYLAVNIDHLDRYPLPRLIERYLASTGRL